jgi:hypothetical protein
MDRLIFIFSTYIVSLNQWCDWVRVSIVRQKTEEEDLIIRYLFRELTEEEQNRVEEKFLTDNRYFEQMLSLEDALIDDYVQGALSDYDRTKVEELLRSSSRQSREIDFVKNLIGDIAELQYDSADKSSLVQEKRLSVSQYLLKLLGIRDSGKRFAFSALLLLAAIILPVIVWNLALQSKLRRTETERATLEKNEQDLQQRVEQQQNDTEELSKELKSEREKRSQLEQELAALQDTESQAHPNGIATMTLTTGSLSRGGGKLAVIYIRPTISQLRIRLDLDEKASYESHSAVIRTFDGRQIWRADSVKSGRANPNRIVLTVPANLFSNEDFTLTLKGKAENGDVVDVGDYSFRVKR